ncbi:MAG: Gfo/Idh/MocA family protein [Pleurocapsa sp.]
MKIGVAVLGAGRWGVHFIRNLARHPQVELLAIVDSSLERLTDCQQKFDLNPETVTLATDWQIIKQLNNLQAVVVATPASTHYSLILDALQQGYHVLAEKPLTLDPQECLQLAQLAADKQLQLLVDHTYLFNPIVERGQQIIASGELGSQLRYGYATRTHLSPVRQDVDALWDLAIHDIAIFNYWLAEKPDRVQARSKVWLQPDKTMNIASQSGLADLVWLTMFYPSGFQAEIHLCWLNTDKQRRLCVVGNQGTLIFDEMSKDAPLTLKQGSFIQQGEQFIPVEQGDRVIEIKTADTLRVVCDRFLDNIRTGEQDTRSSAWVGAELVQILRCLTLSLEQQGKIISVGY